jgi:hypothetical protein
MGWAKERFSAFSEGVGARRFTLGAIFSAVVGAADHIRAALQGQGMIFGFPSWIIGLLVLSIFIAWWLLEYTVKLRRQLRGAIDLENALDMLSGYFDEGNNKYFNAQIKSATEYGAWKAEWRRWYDKVEQHLEETLGARERNLFKNIVLFQPLTIPHNFSADHNFDLNILYRQLETIRDIIIRHSERADNPAAPLASRYRARIRRTLVNEPRAISFVDARIAPPCNPVLPTP